MSRAWSWLTHECAVLVQMTQSPLTRSCRIPSRISLVGPARAGRDDGRVDVETARHPPAVAAEVPCWRSRESERF